ncbi:MAG TPA: SDR family NAD(P)-dependent oxidoreductase [Chitinophagaceae bacterium]|nr:SDR family NAD(P)-dependent oxidoreductase [Chitinophagaceae bacterium]
MRFSNKTVIITGGAGGIGLAVASRFASEGANIVLADISIEQLTKGAEALKSNGFNSVWLSQCDVSNEQQVQATVSGAIDHFGSIDIIVNNAGLMIFKKLEETSGADWNRILNVDLIGAFYFTKYAFLSMKEGGCIINISSIHAVETTPMVSTYAAAKAALLSLTRSSSIEGKAKGIRVNAILPGAIDTPMLWENPNIKAGIEQLNKDSVGKPEDIAGVVAFLASADAGFVQGAMIEVDGGRLNRL